MIYLDNAATTKVSDSVIKAMLPVLSENYGNPSSLHSLGQRSAEILEQARLSIAKNLGASAEEIYFTSGGSEADNMAIISAAQSGKLNNKNHIITTAIEHHAVLNTVNSLKKYGFEVTVLLVDKNGKILPEQVKNAITDKTCLVSVMFANNEIGTVEPIAEIGEICKQKGVIFHTDAVQAAGHLKINVNAQNITMLSISAHKFYGPKGVGALYAKKGTPVFSLIKGGAQEKNKRAGTENLASIVGMATALNNAVGNLEKATEYVTFLRNKLILGLSQIPRSLLNGDKTDRLAGNVSFCFEGIEGESLLLLLNDKGICASSGSACTSGSLDPSHVLLAIGRDHATAHGSLRLSLSEQNTEQEIDYTVNAVKQAVEYLRGFSPVWQEIVKERK